MLEVGLYIDLLFAWTIYSPKLFSELKLDTGLKLVTICCLRVGELSINILLKRHILNKQKSIFNTILPDISKDSGYFYTKMPSFANNRKYILKLQQFYVIIINTSRCERF